MKPAAIILAGAPADDALRGAYGVQWRGDVPINGAPMVQIVSDAMKLSGCFDQVIVVGGSECGADLLLESRGSFLENIMAGAEAVEENNRLVISSCDIPLITPEHIQEFVRQALEIEADFVYPIINQKLCLQHYPQFKRTYVRVKEGTYTGGNMVLVDRSFLLSARPRIQALFDARKEPLKIARMIGVATLIRIVAAQKLVASAADIRSLENTVGRVMQGTLRALEVTCPEIGEDVDEMAEIRKAESVLQERRVASNP